MDFGWGWPQKGRKGHKDFYWGVPPSFLYAAVGGDYFDHESIEYYESFDWVVLCFNRRGRGVGRDFFGGCF